MTLWIAYNGYQGYGPVGAIVEAPDEDSARQAASEAFRNDPDRNTIDDNIENYATITGIRELELPYIGDTL